MLAMEHHRSRVHHQGYVASGEGIPVTRRKTRKLLIAAVLGAGGLALAAWVVNLAFISLDESAAPPATSLPAVPSGADVIGTEKLCASGGCWQEATVAPSDGESPDELAARMGLTAEKCSPGNIIDPRSICRGSMTSRDGQLVIYVSYWSRGY
jgi:hypothetical protein